MSLFAALFLGCVDSRKEKTEVLTVPDDLSRIKESGVLNVVIDYNSTNYFIYRGKPMGYQYDLIQALCKDLEVKPVITVSNNMAESFEGLKDGTFDLIAKNLTVTRVRQQEVLFTRPIKQTRQVIVQRRKAGSNDSIYINSTLELVNKAIHVQKNTTYYNRLLNLSEEIGGAINVIQDSINGVEQLIGMVSRGEINYTVCDENVAHLNKSYYPNLDVSLRISFPQNIAWAVRLGSNEWKAWLDDWIDNFKETAEYREIYNMYFVSARTARRLNSEYHSISGGRISEYDDLVKEVAEDHGWDWRLISSIMYHESRFVHDVESWGGAVGLMQLMPATAESLGVEDITDPRQNIEGGVKLLNWLDEQLTEAVPDSAERVKFVLAAYNIGLGHVIDARRLADKYGKDNQIWDDNVDYYLKNKSADKYLDDPVVNWGYARGEEAYNFVNRVTGNYEHYLNLIPE